MVDRDRVVYIDRLTRNAAPMGVVDGRLYQSGNSGEGKTTTDKRLDCNLVGRIQYPGGPVLRDQRLTRQNKHGKRTGSRGSQVSVAICLKSRRAAPGIRSGQARQLAIGSRISGGPS